MIGCSQPRTRLGCGGLLAEAAGEHLVHADAALEHRPLLQRRAREDVARLARMDADAGGVLVEQAGDDVQLGSRSGASGWRLLLSSMSAPAPLAHQWLGLMPLPMKSAANRWGNAGGTVAARRLVAPDRQAIRARAGPSRRRRRGAACGG